MNPAAAAYGRAFLELLDSGAPAAAFERLVTEARAAGAADGVLAELDAAKLAALHIRRELEDRRRREAAGERAWQAHHQFTELVLAGGGAQDIARAVGAVLGADAIILGEQDVPLASSGSRPDVPDMARVISRARGAGRAVCGGNFWAVPATAGSEHLGMLVLRAGPDLPAEDRLILERAAMVTALLLLLRRSVAEAEQRVRGELLSELLSARDRDTESLRSRALRVGADLDKPHVVIVVQAETGLRSRLRDAAAYLAATRHGLAADYEGSTVLLLPGTDPATTVREAAAAFSGAVNPPPTCGAAGPGSGPGAFALAYAQARRCVDGLVALGRTGAAATHSELGFLGMLLSDSRDVPGFISSAIGCLVDYDRRKGTDLVRTVDAYFLCGSNLTRTKDALHVHVNTVTQRLERISRMLGEDWQTGERALEIRIAVHLYRLGAEKWA
jgi:hypothetical protein